MRIFWSWQSDLPGRVSRHFVREALELAIDTLNQERDIVEADRSIELDQDRKGVPGSPDLANVIFEKIKAADVLVADVTPVGQSAGSPAKKLMNPNVAIELGYGLGTISDRKLIMVLNENYGSRDDLPFDLRHKAGPIFYRLPPDAPKNEIEAAKKSLSLEFKTALRLMTSSAPAVAEPFLPTPQSTDPSRFFAPDEPLFEQEGFQGEATTHFVPEAPTLYLRVRPTRKSPQVPRAELLEIARSRFDLLPPLYAEQTGNMITGNKFGVISSAVAQSGDILCAAQVMLNREIWAFDSMILAPFDDGRRLVRTLAVERAFAFCLPRYLRFLEEILAVAPPFEVEAGAHGVKGELYT